MIKLQDRAPVVPAVVLELAARCRDAGGRVLVVGGTVRDALLGRPSRDVDVEVHGISAEALEPLLAGLGRVVAAGKSFGVFKLSAGGQTIDVALPRADSTAGAGASPDVGGDPFIGIAEAARRRDLTINAIGWDPLRDEWFDPRGGRADLAALRLHPADPERFLDDPLRALRVVQLSSRLGAEPSTELVALCRAADLSDQPAERVRGELFRLLEDGVLPGQALRLAGRLGLLAQVLPEVERHLDVVAHALDRAGRTRDDAGAPPRALAMMLAVLLHRCTEDEVVAVLERLGVQTYLRFPIAGAVRRAVGRWRTLQEAVSDETLRRLAEPDGLALVGLCALAAAIPGTPEHAVAQEALQRAQTLGIVHQPVPPLVRGRDLQRAGVPAGPLMGVLLEKIRLAQLRGEITSTEEALAYALRLRDGATS